MAQMDENFLSLARIRWERFRFSEEEGEPLPCHAECLPYRPDNLKETLIPWQWGSRPGFLRTRDDAVMHSLRLEIPAVWQGQAVIGFERFCYTETRVREVVFPEGLTEIADEAFSHAVILRVLRFPATLRRIGNYAFSFQDQLEQLVLPEGLEELGEGAFCSCSSLRRIELPSTLCRIGPSAFERDSGLPRGETAPPVFVVPAVWRGSRMLWNLLESFGGDDDCRVEYRD